MPEGLLVHDLRDAAASLAISVGASIKAIQRMLGHSSASMTLDVYASLFEEDLEDLAVLVVGLACWPPTMGRRQLVTSRPKCVSQ